ncbi:hypothetical protein Pcinc_043886 [Petrolisthes cinctipes]|uniref:Uncharacterized protein n=1 Tax=Petrolisthes cinctipes TaxID=88211 RepID=A0AAE1EFS2_PETCI|nr:hypothetical protein Pcinc_043886 [Petrolisthes cinctipes]
MVSNIFDPRKFSSKNRTVNTAHTMITLSFRIMTMRTRPLCDLTRGWVYYRALAWRDGPITLWSFTLFSRLRPPCTLPSTLSSRLDPNSPLYTLLPTRPQLSPLHSPPDSTPSSLLYSCMLVPTRSPSSFIPVSRTAPHPNPPIFRPPAPPPTF